MALYQYKLTIAREASNMPLTKKILNEKYITHVVDNEYQILNGIPTWLSEEKIFYKNKWLDLLSIEIDESALESLIQEDFNKFLSWLWLVFALNGIAYGYMSSPSYSAYYDLLGINEEDVKKKIGEIVCDKKIDFIHPLMFFSNAFFTIKPIENNGSEFYTLFREPNIGTIFIFMENEGEVEILDLGNIYKSIKVDFQKIVFAK